MNRFQKGTLVFCLVAGCAGLLAGCGKKKDLARDYSDAVEVPPYKGQTIDRYVSEVTDADVQSYIEDELSFSAEYKDVTDRPAQNGDLAMVDYVGTIDGKEFEGGSDTDAQIELGAGEYIEGFEEAIVGMNVGEEKDADIVFPTPYDGTLDGKTAKFHFKLTSLVEVLTPEYNDAFVASISDYDTTDAYETAIREELETTYAQDADALACEEFLTSLVETAVYKSVPEDLSAACKEAQDAEHTQLQEIFGIDDLSDFYGEEYSPELELNQSINERLVVYTIAAKEKIAVTDEDYQDALAADLAYNDYDTVEEYESEEVTNPDNYKYDLLRDKVIAFLAENNTFHDISEEEYFEEADGELLDDADIEVLDGDAALTGGEDAELLDEEAIDGDIAIIESSELGEENDADSSAENEGA